jgi:uncharacterized membrane protein (DUF4010 family)
MENLTPYYRLGVALALGFLIGLERGWQDREQPEGTRVAGVRTFALIGLLGGVIGLLAQQLGQFVLAIAFAALAVLLVWAHGISQQLQQDVGITGIIAALLTFCFGAMAAFGQELLATVATVVTAILLGIKPLLHRWVRLLQEQELFATLKLLVISLVVLPLLPDQGYGPWQALNPYRIWWMVVLVAGISYLGYFAMRIVGPRKGILATGLFGGLASSTAATVELARGLRGDGRMLNVRAAGITVAGASMFPRILVIAAIYHRGLAMALLWPIAVMTVVNYLAGWFFWRRREGPPDDGGAGIRNPFEAKPALIFGALLAAIMLLSRGLSEQFGTAGVYLAAATSGLANVDAITLSMADMAGERVAIPAAAGAILVAAFVNAGLKAGLALGFGGRALGLRVGAATAVVVASGLVSWWLST